MKYQRVTTHLAETMSKLDVDKAMIRRLTEVIMQDISQIHLTQATDLL